MKTLQNNIQPFDIFYKEYKGEYDGTNGKHYYVCIYAQELDGNNRLKSDVYGIMVTTNMKYENLPNDYNVKIEINGRPCFALCDKLFRLKIEDTLEVKGQKLSTYQKSEITEKLNKFYKEVQRQMGETTL
jgi:hypothetical protein